MPEPMSYQPMRRRHLPEHEAPQGFPWALLAVLLVALVLVAITVDGGRPEDPMPCPTTTLEDTPPCPIRLGTRSGTP